jgi:hypothetical protein
MGEHHSRLRVRFYPSHGEWTCIVQRVDAEGMPVEDVVSGLGKTKDDARNTTLDATDDAEVREALRSSVH